MSAPTNSSARSKAENSRELLSPPISIEPSRSSTQSRGSALSTTIDAPFDAGI